MTYEQRFWSHVAFIPEHPCWEWVGALFPSGGYGAFKASGRTVRAHRVSWELDRGLIPDGLHVCHHCDNPSCVRPDHLFLGTDADNMRDCVAKGRHGNQNTGRAHCIRGHVLDGENCGTSKGSRYCRQCIRDYKLWKRHGRGPRAT